MLSHKFLDNWFIRFKPSPSARVRLFCFPYAGGMATLFRSWAQTLPPDIEVYAAQPPGRGGRISEPAFTHITAMVESVGAAIKPHLDKPFAFFGHSMGALISFDLAHLLCAEVEREPVRLFVSGTGAPHTKVTEKRTFLLPDAEFIEELRRLNGTPPEVLEHAELMQLMLPLLRADFSVSQTYEYTERAPLTCPLTVFAGSADSATREQLEAWRELTTSDFSLKMFPGDHFFLHAAQPDILRVVGQQLTQF